MANVTTYLDNSLPQISREGRNVFKSKTIASAAANSGDRIQFFRVPAGANWRLTSAVLAAMGTLGASATLKLQVDRAGVYTDITAATTAGGASKVSSAAIADVPFDLNEGDIISALVGGANIGAQAVVKVSLEVTNR